MSAYAEVYLREEIQDEGIVRNVGAFARFLDVAAAQSGEILNAAAASQPAIAIAPTRNAPPAHGMRRSSPPRRSRFFCMLAG